MDIRNLVKPNVRRLKPYQAEEIPCRVKLDANESPYGLRVMKTVETNRYPDPEARGLRQLIAEDLGVNPENILHGNGSDELISYLIMTFGGPVLYPTPTFSMYGIIAQSLGQKKIEVPLLKNFDLDTRQFLEMIKTSRPKLIFLSSPNNPTGNCFSIRKIEEIILESTSIVVVDEAYQPFAGNRSFISKLRRYKNLVVLRTLSKIGLAGLRTGFMISAPEIVNEVNKIRLPFNLNSLSQRLAIDALKDSRRIDRFIKSIVSERRRLSREMKKIKGVKVFPSDANFILFRTESSEKVYQCLMEQGVLIRNISGAVKNCLRVTVGTPRENRIFLNALRKAI